MYKDNIKFNLKTSTFIHKKFSFVFQAIKKWFRSAPYKIVCIIIVSVLLIFIIINLFIFNIIVCFCVNDANGKNRKGVIMSPF